MSCVFYLPSDEYRHLLLHVRFLQPFGADTVVHGLSLRLIFNHAKRDMNVVLYQLGRGANAVEAGL